MSDELKLKLCPFCGGEAWVIQILEDLYAVECRKCWTRTGTYQPTKAEAIEAWNRRAVPERKKGRWIYDTERVAGDGWTYRQYHCTECGFQELGWLANFCPSCGAEMRGE